MECPYCAADQAPSSTRCEACGSDLDALSEPGWLDRVAHAVLDWMSASEAEVRAWVVAQQTATPAAGPEEIAQQAVRSAKFWTGSIGFIAGLGDFLGPLGFGAGTVTDIYYAARLSVQMGQRIYCAYGHDIATDEVRVRILAALGGGTAATGKVAGDGSVRVAKRLLEKYLRGALLKAIKAFLRKLGLVFTRKALVAALPLLGSGVNAVVNRSLMGKLGDALLQDVRGV